MLPYPQKQRLRARKLRTDFTGAEQKLWMHLRARQLCDAKFRRQHPIGPFIVDFCCVESHLVIELDGGQHAESAVRDSHRTAFIGRQGFLVLRFWNNDVLANVDGVLERIVEALKRPHPSPLPEGEGGRKGAPIATRRLRKERT